MPKETICSENFCHRAYRRSKRGKQVCPRKQFPRKIFVTGHTRKASEGNRYAQGSDFSGKFQSSGIPEKQAREIGMPEEAIIPGNFCRGAYRRSRRGKQVCPRKRFSRKNSVTGHTRKASKRTGMPKKAIFPEKFCHRAYQESKQGEQVCPRKRLSRKNSVTGHTGKANKGNRYARGNDFPGKFLSPGIPGKQARGIGMPKEAIIPGNFCHRAYQKSKRETKV